MGLALEQQLAAVDWDFEGGWTQCGLHRLHWYPGTFIPQIAGTLVRLLTRPGQTVLDPFCGCGTTLLEAIRLGRNAVGLDSNPLGVLVSQAKCQRFRISRLRNELSTIICSCAGSLFASAPDRKLLPNTAELSRWFSPSTLGMLQRIWLTIQSDVDDQDRVFFLVCLSHILKSTCSQGRHWGWVADNVAPKTLKDRDALSAFARHADAMIAEFNDFYGRLKTGSKGYTECLAQTRAMLHDCREPLPIGLVDAVVTSPPYPCVVDYVRAQRLSYEFFGWNRVHDEVIEIGGRWKRFRKNQLDEYRRDILIAFANIDRVLKPGGVIGLVFDSTERHRRDVQDSARVDLAGLLGEHFNYRSVGEHYVRKLSSQRLVDRSGSKNHEHIIVLRKPK